MSVLAGVLLAVVFAAFGVFLILVKTVESSSPVARSLLPLNMRMVLRREYRVMSGLVMVGLAVGVLLYALGILPF